MNYIISSIIGYIIGSFPTAYIILKLKHDIDITQAGSGNVGALNSLHVSKSKTLGISVLLIDLFKGILSVALVKYFVSEEFIFPMIGLLAAVFAHCYSPWLKFKGGRGLATAAGGALILSIPVLLIWVALFGVSYLLKKNIHFANFVATIFSAAIAILFSNLLNKYSNTIASSNNQFGFAVLVMMLIILSKHIQPVKEYFQNQKMNN